MTPFCSRLLRVVIRQRRVHTTPLQQPCSVSLSNTENHHECRNILFFRVRGPCGARPSFQTKAAYRAPFFSLGHGIHHSLLYHLRLFSFFVGSAKESYGFASLCPLHTAGCSQTSGFRVVDHRGVLLLSFLRRFQLIFRGFQRFLKDIFGGAGKTFIRSFVSECFVL